MQHFWHLSYLDEVKSEHIIGPLLSAHATLMLCSGAAIILTTLKLHTLARRSALILMAMY